MKAIILPLNKFFFYFEKYDGSTAPERFVKTHPQIFGIMSSKAMKSVVLMPVVYCCGVLAFVFIFGPPFLRVYLTSGKAAANRKCNERLDSFGKWLDKLQPQRRKDIKPKLNKFKWNKFSVFVYYTPEMIPAKPNERQNFFERIEKMKSTLELKEVVFAEGKQDIENLMTTYEVNVAESFFMSDGKISLDSLPILQSFIV